MSTPSKQKPKKISIAYNAVAPSDEESGKINVISTDVLSQIYDDDWVLRDNTDEILLRYVEKYPAEISTVMLDLLEAGGPKEEKMLASSINVFARHTPFAVAKAILQLSRATDHLPRVLLIGNMAAIVSSAIADGEEIPPQVSLAMGEAIPIIFENSEDYIRQTVLAHLQQFESHFPDVFSVISEKLSEDEYAKYFPDSFDFN